MNKQLNILGISGARSGSRTLPNKNTRMLGDKPLLAWPAGIAKSSKHINRYILSTDSEEYAALANKCGIETPFIQPAETATDQSIVLEFIEHALSWLEENKQYKPDLVVYLCPTTPFVRAEDVDAGIELLLSDPSAHSAVLISAASQHPRKAVKMSADEKYVVSYMTGKGIDVAPSNRQSYEKAYNRESLPVITRTSTLKEMHSQTGEVIRFHEISKETALDIDDAFDFSVVEMMLERHIREDH